MSDWLADFYRDVDAMNLQGFLDRHTDDVVVTFGNNPPAIGKEQVGQAIGGFFQTVDGMKHTFVNVFTDGDTTILEADIEYTRKDGARVNVPSGTVLHRRDGLVDRLTIYIDLAPVFAPAMSTF
jgi:ketosteroid isomerase-like protein